MQIHSAHSTSTKKDVTIDGVDAVSESATVPTTTKSGQPGTTSPSQGEATSPGPTPSCSGSKVKKLKPGNITCTASSHYGPAWACRKESLFHVKHIIVLTLQHSGVWQQTEDREEGKRLGKPGGGRRRLDPRHLLQAGRGGQAQGGRFKFFSSSFCSSQPSIGPLTEQLYLPLFVVRLFIVLLWWHPTESP